MFAHPTRLVDWLQYIRAEFEEPSNLRVTTAEACARWPLEPLRLTSLLEALVHAGYLRRSADGAYFRRPEADFNGDLTRLSPLGARASVPRDAFDELTIGTPAAVVEEPGEKGPQASTVRVLGKHHYVSP